jgi:hypothetical protein
MTPATMDMMVATATKCFYLVEDGDTTYSKGRKLDVDAHLVGGRCIKKLRGGGAKGE